MEICYLLLCCCCISTYITKWHNLGSYYQELIICEHRRVSARPRDPLHKDSVLAENKDYEAVAIVKQSCWQGWSCVVQRILCSLKINFYLLPQHINHGLEVDGGEEIEIQDLAELLCVETINQ